MQVTAPDRDEVRRLAEMRLDRPVVLSLYLDLDPAEFATPSARATAVRSLLDEADRRIRDHDELPHDDRMALRASLERASALLEGDLPTEGAQALAVFAAESAGMFEALKLPRPLPNRVAVRRSPLIAPLARLERRERWCVALVNRRDARVFRGSQDGVREVEQIHDTVFGQHDQGRAVAGALPARHREGEGRPPQAHGRRADEALQAAPFERLLAGGPREVVADFESKLHGYLTERLRRAHRGGRGALDARAGPPRPCSRASTSSRTSASRRRWSGSASRARGDRVGGRAARAERAACGDAARSTSASRPRAPAARRAAGSARPARPHVPSTGPSWSSSTTSPRRRSSSRSCRTRTCWPCATGARSCRTAPAESPRCCASRPAPRHGRAQRVAQRALVLEGKRGDLRRRLGHLLVAIARTRSPSAVSPSSLTRRS